MKQRKKYSKYKESSLEWFDEVPEHWEKRKLSWIFEIIGSGTTPTSGTLDYYDGEIPWLITGDLNDGILESTSKTVTDKALLKYSTLKLFPENSLVIAMYGATIGKLALTTFKTTTNQACCVMSCPANADIWFMFYWLSGNKKEIINLSQGGGQPNISQGIIKSLRLYCPPLKEQTQIANFLNQKTAEIDSLIFDKETLISLLKEQRQAMITEAVTKGLNPEVKMKDSGVEWIGRVPEQWKVFKASRVLRIFGSATIAESDITENGLDFYKVDNLNDSSNGLYISSSPYKVSKLINPIVPVGALLLPKRGAAIFTNKVRITLSPCYIDPNLMGILPSDILHVEFLAYVLLARRLNDIADISTIPQINNKHINVLKLALPSYQEQLKIVDYIKMKTTVIVDLINELIFQINKLKDYRQSLIYEAVTGKIDVRNYAASELEVEI